MLKIAKHYNLFEKDAEELKKWRTIYHKEFTDLTDDFRNLKKDSKIMSNNKNK
jgi:predicted transcriptional regulator